MFWLDNCLASNQEKSNYLIDCNIKKQKLVKQKNLLFTWYKRAAWRPLLGAGVALITS